MARIISNRRIAPGYYRMRIFCPPLAARAKPGQFVMIRVGCSIDPLLRRPFAVHRVCRETAVAPSSKAPPSCIEILYRTVGRGTLLLSRKKRGEAIDLLGPLGTGFNLPAQLAKAVLVGGGIGVAPLLFLAQVLNRKRPPVSSTVIIGGATRGDILCCNDFRMTAEKVAVSTEDGSRGMKGLATDLLEEALGSPAPLKAVRLAVYACGPLPMLERVAAIARNRAVFCQVSLESTMACGVGACLGCSVPAGILSERAVFYQRVCREGPVFDAAAVAWDRLASDAGKR